MAQFFSIHPTHPQTRLIEQTASWINQGGVVALPTDARFLLVCAVDDAKAQQNLRVMRNLSDDHLFSLLCQDLAQISEYANVDNMAFRLLKSCLPGPYTIVLKGTKHLGKKICHPKRKTVGVRIPRHAVVQALLQYLGKPLVATSLEDEDGHNYTSAEAIKKDWGRQLAVIINTGEQFDYETTVLDLTTEPYQCLRQGSAPLPW